MRFRFCGEQDCPDWVLAEIATLSRITSIKMKLLCNQVVNGILGIPIDLDKVDRLTADAKYEKTDIKATIAALSFIFQSSAKHGIDEESLSNELQQLGLPKESTSALCKVYSENNIIIREKLRQDSLRLTEMMNVNWQVNHILWTSSVQEVSSPGVSFTFNVIAEKELITDPRVQQNVDMSSEKFDLLLHELKHAASVMDEANEPS